MRRPKSPPILAFVELKHNDPVAGLRKDELSLIVQPAQSGHHALFEEGLIERALAAPMPQGDHGAMVEQVDVALRNLLAPGELSQKRELVAALPETVQHVVVKLYFRLMDQVLAVRGGFALH